MQKDNIRTRFGIDELVTVRDEPNKDGPEIFARAENGLKKGKSDHFFIANNEVVFIIVKVTPIEDRRYVTGIEFYGNHRFVFLWKQLENVSAKIDAIKIG